MIKIICDICSSEIREGEANGVLATAELNVLKGGNQVVETKRNLCRKCLQETRTFLADLSNKHA